MRATRAVIHLDKLRSNLEQIREHIAPGTRICLAVKADAYGHGIVAVAELAKRSGVDYLAVATVDEALELRSSGVELPILLYSLPIPEEIESICRWEITPLIGDIELVERLAAEAARQRRRVDVHMKIDTGMGRIGCRPDEAADLAERIAGMRTVRLAGVSTHFPVADTADPSATIEQTKAFQAAVAEIRDRGIDPGIIHAANSGAVLDKPHTHLDMVRPGIMAYGYYPSREQGRGMLLEPVMELRSAVVFLKTVEKGSPISYGMTWRAPRRTVIGTIPVGYADGYNRLLSNRGEVWIRGRRYPVVGRVCMDQIMVDLGPDSSIPKYEEVVLFGPQPGAPTAEELAGLTDTIPYEVTCAVSKRVPRVYAEQPLTAQVAGR
jgi:alanine racemase